MFVQIIINFVFRFHSLNYKTNRKIVKFYKYLIVKDLQRRGSPAM